VQIFGYKLEKNSLTKPQKLDAFSPRQVDDGALVVQEGGVFGTYLDLDGNAKTEGELINRYREMALQPEIDTAIDDIVNEMVSYETEDDLCTINLEAIKYSDSIKSRIRKEFKEILRLLDFNNCAYDICRRWYIDGRMYYHTIIDENNVDAGIQELRYIDPRKLRKIREIRRVNDTSSGNINVKTKSEYYVYNEMGFGPTPVQTSMGYQATTGVRISPDSIVHTTSGLMDQNNTLVLSYLHKAIKPLNQLRTLEDATIIYTLVRSPQRRIFSVDVGNLPRAKAEQYMRDQIVRHKNKLVYDSATGEVRDDRKFMTMLEDYWFAKRDGGRGTEVNTMDSGGSLMNNDNIEFFKKKLMMSLNLPMSRIQEGASFNMGRSSEITRDELKFGKMIDRMRLRFSQLFIKTLEKQLVLKRIISIEEAPDLWRDSKFEFAKDSFFTEFKEGEILKERLAMLEQADPFVGKYFSNLWIRKHILYQSDEEIEEMQKDMDKDELNGLAAQNQPAGGGGMPMDPSMGGGDPAMAPGAPDQGNFPPSAAQPGQQDQGGGPPQKPQAPQQAAAK
jgi:hypothetical protein